VVVNVFRAVEIHPALSEGVESILVSSREFRSRAQRSGVY